MHADVAAQALELPRQRQQFAGFFLGLFALLEPRLHFARHLQRDQLAGLERNQFRQFVGAAVVPFHHAADIANHGLGGHGAEGDDLRHRVVAVFAANVVDYPIAAVLAKIHVEVRHGYALRIQEALEQQAVAQRIEIGDAERVGHQRARTRTAPGTDRHAVGLGPVDEVGNDQEVTGKPHLHDGVDLELETLAIARHVLSARRRVRITREHAFFEAGDRPVVQEGFERHAVWCREQRQPRLAEFERKAAAARDLDRVFQRLRQVGKQLRHLRLALEVLLLGEMARAALVGQHIALGDADPGLMSDEIPALDELHRMGRHDRQFQRGGKAHRTLDVVLRVRLTGTLQLDVEALRKQFRPELSVLFCLARIVSQQRMSDVAEMGARQCNQPVRAAYSQPFLFDLGAATMLVGAIGAREPVAELQVTYAGSAQEQGAVGLVAVGFVGDPDIAADQRLEPLAARSLVELHHAEEVGQIGQREGRHAVRRRGGHRVVDADDAVDDRVFAVQAQMDELRLHGRHFTPSIQERNSIHPCPPWFRYFFCVLGLGRMAVSSKRHRDPMQFINLAGYKFVSLDGLDDLKAMLDRRCGELELKGTILLSFEGINVVLAGSEAATTDFQSFVHADPRFADLRFKRSISAYQPFDRMLVKIKKEIITLRAPGVDPAKERAPAVAPVQLKRWLDEGREVVLLDTRNAFEVDAGTFDNAMDLRLSSFGQFAQAADRLDPSLKDKTIVTFCTGGIRCEKAAPVLIGKGFRNVFQLDGGILKYFEECGDAHFKGRCFVFDQRVALDGNLRPEVADTQ